MFHSKFRIYLLSVFISHNGIDDAQISGDRMTSLRYSDGKKILAIEQEKKMVSVVKLNSFHKYRPKWKLTIWKLNERRQKKVQSKFSLRLYSVNDVK